MCKVKKQRKCFDMLDKSRARGVDLFGECRVCLKKRKLPETHGLQSASQATLMREDSVIEQVRHNL